ncbi:Poly [ADP-ribose] polymerase [Quillaja saponaria]|uniref:Poly [ADP-ribose] polymerase n=1 Tax=Quillaja saponaria TaxID=32244 RepID=A0AAD7LXG4_QUISA|nr:Poly [ADP-ribose] polymerase [Quillaja saponaria]
MASSDTTTQKKMVESVMVRVPQNSISSSTAKVNPKVRFNRRSDCCSSKLMIQNHSNFKSSAAPVRFMFYQGGSWVDFQSQVLESIRVGFSEGKAVLEVTIAGATYLFDFLYMVQIDCGTGKQRSIAWIDETGKCFFPKVFVGEELVDGLENSEIPEIEIRIRIDGDAGKRKSEHFDLKGKEAEVSSSSKNNSQEEGSKRRRLISTDLETLRWPDAKFLTREDKAYSVVSNFFLSGIMFVDSGATITAIHQCLRSQPMNKARYQVFKKQNEITKASRGSSNMVYAWYGASAEAVALILTHGFGLPSTIAGSPTYGVGIYLSPVGLPHQSAMQSEADDKGEKHVVLCRVILGNVEKVEAGSQQRYPSSVEFDTGADDPNDPKWLVVWCAIMNRHILPVCVVSYKVSAHLPGHLEESNCTKNSFSKLFSKMISSLPSFKVQEVITLYDTFKLVKRYKCQETNVVLIIRGNLGKRSDGVLSCFWQFEI